MDLDTILKKTKRKSLRVTKTRTPVLIATSDRPYNLNVDQNKPKQTDNNISINTIQNVIKKNDEVKKELVTNWEQTDNKVITNWEQTDNKVITNWEQSGNKLGTKPITQVVTNWEQTDNKVVTKTPFSTLVGLQKNIVIFFYKECNKNRSKFTKPLTLEYIADHVKTKTGTVKMTIRRLEMKGSIIRKEFKNGRSGWTKYELPNDIFHEVLQLESDNKVVTNWEQTDNKVGTKLVTKPITTPLSSSISYNNTTTENKENFEKVDLLATLPKDWLKINFNPLHEIGFSETQLCQLAEENLNTPEIVQESINHFAFGLANNEKYKEYTNPLNVLMGVLRKGQRWFEQGYEDPQDKILREILEEKKQRKEKREQMIKELVDLEFPEWEKKLSQEEVEAIVPFHARKIRGARTSMLRVHFTEKVLLPRLAQETAIEATGTKLDK